MLRSKLGSSGVGGNAFAALVRGVRLRAPKMMFCVFFFAAMFVIVFASHFFSLFYYVYD